MKPTHLLAVGAISLAISSQTLAANNTFTYDHEWEDETQGHTDEFKLGHKFDMGLKAALTLKFQPMDKNDGKPGDAFNNDRWSETKISLGYPIKLTPDLKLEPGGSWSRKRGTYKYKPSLKLKYQLTNDLNVGVQYRKEITDYVQDKKTKRVNRYGVGANYSINNKFSVGYVYYAYQGNTNLFNSKKTNSKQEYSLEYKLNDKITPYIEVKDESVSSKTDDRQKVYEVGFSYKF